MKKGIGGILTGHLVARCEESDWTACGSGCVVNHTEQDVQEMRGLGLWFSQGVFCAEENPGHDSGQNQQDSGNASPSVQARRCAFRYTVVTGGAGKWKD